MARVSDGSIIAMRTDRLGSRLAAIINAMRVADTYQRDYRFTWALGGHVSEELRHPAEIFDMEYFDAHVVSDAELRPVLRGILDLSLAKPDVVEPLLKGQPKRGAFKSTAYQPLILDWEDAESTREQLSDMFDRIGFNPQMREAMAHISDSIGQDARALHIRRGDIIDDHIISNRLWSDKYIPRAFYQCYLEKHVIPHDQKAIIFSDTPAEVAWFKDHYANAISIDDIMPAQPTVAQRDFLELYAMSQCDTIIGPPDSAFSIAAAAIGGRKIIDVRDALSEEDIKDAHEVLTTSLETGPDTFNGLGDAGQTLAFALEYLNETGQSERSNRLVHQYLDAGLDKVYFFGMAVERLSVARDFEDCRAAFTKAQQAVPVRMFPSRIAEFWSDAQCSVALACLGMNDPKAAIFHLGQGVWNSGNGSAAKVLGHFVELEIVEGGDFIFPLDVELMAPVDATAKADRFGKQLLDLHQATELKWQMPEDQLSRDWSAFMFSTRMVEPNLAGRRLRRYFHPHCPIYVWQSSFGTYLSAAGDHANAIRHHRNALKRMPDNPLYLKRMASALFEAGDGIEALALLDRAAEIAPDQIIYQAEFARQLAAAGDLKTGATLMSELCQSESSIPAIPQKAVELRRQAGLIDDDLEGVMSGAITLAPSHRALNLLQAHVLADLGKWADATIELDKLLLHYGDAGDLKQLAQRITTKQSQGA